MLTITVLAAVSLQAQPYTVLDSIKSQDRKVRGAGEIQEKAWNLFKQLISEEKTENDTVINLAETWQLYNTIESAVSVYSMTFLTVDTITVTDSLYQVWMAEYGDILSWIASVENDSDIENVKDHPLYKKKQARRKKLISFNKQIVSQQ